MNPLKVLTSESTIIFIIVYINFSIKRCAEAGWQKQANALASRASDSSESCGFKRNTGFLRQWKMPPNFILTFPLPPHKVKNDC